MAKRASEVSLNDRFYKVLRMRIPHMRFIYKPNAFLMILGVTFVPFWGPLGPRSADGFGILGSRSDEIGNSGIIELFLFARAKKRSHITCNSLAFNR